MLTAWIGELYVAPDEAARMVLCAAVAVPDRIILQVVHI